MLRESGVIAAREGRQRDEGAASLRRGRGVIAHDHICYWILNSNWKPALRNRVLQLEVPWRGRAPKLSTPRR